MTHLPETTAPQPEQCPGCQHPQHAPGTECETRVNHSPNHFHVCLCLARPGAELACPPQMTCQGGTLGYTDIWYLQRGHSLSGANGETITPDVLKVAPADRPASTAPLAAGLPLVQGRCPACQRASLFLGSGGYVTCSSADCPEPDAATTVLEGGANWPAIRAAIYREVADELAGINFHPNAKSQNLELCRLLAGRFRRKADEVERVGGEAQQAEEPTVGPRCGNNPNARLTPGDRQAVKEFREYLARRRAGGPPERNPFTTSEEG